MKVEYINPFVDSAKSVLKNMCSLDCQKGKLKIKKMEDMSNSAEVSIIVGVVGKVRGRVIYDMSRTTALKIVSIMNMEELTDFNTMAWDTLGEVANIITGNSITALNQRGFATDITPPTIIAGQNKTFVDVPRENMRVLIVPLITKVGELLINLALKEHD